MKILSAQQNYDVEKETLKSQNIDTLALIERAAKIFVSWFQKNFALRTQTIIVFCGLGNNGSDGLAIARLLSDLGYQVVVYIVRHSVKVSKEFQIEAAKIRNGYNIQILEITQNSLSLNISPAAIIIDAILGSGVNRPLAGLLLQIVETINQLPNYKIAIDVPSGLAIDTDQRGVALEADTTITFQQPKLSFMFSEAFQYVGNWLALDLGLDLKQLENDQAIANYLSLFEAQLIFKKRKREKFDHKGKFGHVLLIGGSKGKMGAAVLMTKAAIHSGSGKVTVHIPNSGNEILQTAIPEAMVSLDPDSTIVTEVLLQNDYRAIAIGPGLGTNIKTQQAFEKLLSQVKIPLIIDADAINILAIKPEMLKILPKNSLLTPHDKEFRKIFGEYKNGFERLKIQLNFSRENQIYILYKGAHSTLTTPDGEIFFNSTGNPGLAKGGSGDVLTGIISGLAAQGYSMQDAALLGMFLHGLSADFAEKDLTEYWMTATDIITYLSKAVKLIMEENFRS
ncbi:MAG: NAD(P)H-hydrate dehydratase [bacterium]